MNFQPLFMTARVFRAVYQIVSTALLLAYLAKHRRRAPRRPRIADYRDNDD